MIVLRILETRRLNFSRAQAKKPHLAQRAARFKPYISSLTAVTYPKGTCNIDRKMLCDLDFSECKFFWYKRTV